jgi:N-acyl-D-aspartate/D-glutamate deacylase
MIRVALALSLAIAPPLLAQNGYDVVLQGGRVMDPETGFDAVRNVGIRGDRIVDISAKALSGRDVVDVSGLVVAPGFIDLHAHGQTNAANEYQAHDGVTTALELELGVPFVEAWLDTRRGKALLNFGATASHAAARWMAMDRYAEEARRARAGVDEGGGGPSALTAALASPGTARYEAVSPGELEAMTAILSTGLSQGALGIGVPVGYYPGATREELFRVYQVAAARDVPVYTHVRDPDIPAIQEAIANSGATGASVHIVHLNSMALGRVAVALDMIDSAQEQGLDVTTELYPYTAGSTLIESTLFDDDWKDVFGIDYQDLQWVATGERLTEETFTKYRAEGGTLILHVMKEEWIETGLRAPFTMIGSDGMPYAPLAHPRSAGTFSRVLGRYVRERHTLSLMEALGKMTILPARRAESAAASMRLKGRLQVGCDADITVFDPARVIDTATFGQELSFARGIPHVLVNGAFVVRDGETVPGAHPGRAVMGKYRN